MDWFRKSLLYDADFGRDLLTLLFGKHGTSFGVDDGIFLDKLVGKSVDRISSSLVSGEPEILCVLK